MNRISNLLVATSVACVLFLPTSHCDAGRVVGLSIGSGAYFPLGDLADKDKIGANVGLRGTYAIDIYIKEALSIGVFINGDFFKPASGYVSLGDTRVRVSKGAAGEGGVSIRYFFSTGTRLQPFAKTWVGTSWLHLEAPTGTGADSDAAMGWGIGAGLMFQPTSHIGLSGELMYNNTKTGDTPSLTTSRISLGVQLHLLIG